MLTAADIALMQSTANTVLLTTPCTIQHKTSPSDGMGGQTDTWSTLATTTCRVAPARDQDREQINQGRLEELDRYNVYLPAGQDISIRDRIVALDTTYEVTAVSAPRTIEVTRVVQAIVVVS